MSLQKLFFSLLLVAAVSLPAFAQPAAPSGLSVTTFSNSQLNLAWTDNSNNETGFLIERSTSSGSGYTQIATPAANAVTFNNTGLTAGYTYYYRIRSTNGSGPSAYSAVASGTTLPSVPAAPTALAAATASSVGINLTWTDNSSVEAGFQVERSLSAGSGFALITTTGANILGYQNTGLTPGTKYYYRVRATNTGGNSAYTSVVNATTNSIPPEPSALTASGATATSVNLGWTDNSPNETSFAVEYSTYSGSGYTVSSTTAANAVTATVTGLSPATQYYFRVRALNTYGPSGYTAETILSTLPLPPTAPGGLVVPVSTATSITLNWTDNSNNETGFLIERSLTSGSGFTQVGTVGTNAVSYSDPGLTNATRYYYRIRATNTGGSSAYTAETSGNTLPGIPIPAGITSNLQLWLKADAGVAGTTTASSWSDQSGNGYVASPTVATHPSIVANSVNFNPTLQFNQNSAFAIAGGILGTATYNDYNVFVVARTNGINASGPFNELVNPGPFCAYLGWTDYTVQYKLGYGNQGITPAFPVLDGFSQWSFMASAFTGTPGKTGASMDIYNNGTILASNASTIPFTGAGNDMIIGSLYNTSYFYTGNIAEMIFYKGALTSLQFQKIQSYLAIKYGTTLNQTTPTSYLSADGTVAWDAVIAGAFKNDIAVIGRDDAAALLQKQSASINTGNILSIGNFSLDDTNQLNSHNFNNDRSFFSWAHNNLAVDVAGVTDFTAPLQKRLARVWKAQETGAIGQLKLRFDISSLSASIAPADARLIVDADGTFASGAAVVAPSSVNATTGIVEFDVDFNNASGYYFTIGSSNITSLNTTALNDLCFQYQYDALNRMSHKKVPGAGWVYIVYDTLDRPVMTQDANQRAAKQWTYTLYDVLSRPVVTGIYTHGTVIDQPAMSALISTTDLYETFSGSGTNQGYTNNVFSSLNFDQAGFDPLTVTYYDNYDFNNGDTIYSYVTGDLPTKTINSVVYSQPSANAVLTGLVTGTMVKALDADAYWLKSVNYYDARGSVIQNISDHQRTGTNRTTNLYDFAGKVLSTKTTYFEMRIPLKDLAYIKLEGNKILCTRTDISWWQNGGSSVAMLPAPGAGASDGWVETTGYAMGGWTQFGLASAQPDHSSNNLDYSILLGDSHQCFGVYEFGVLRYSTPIGSIVQGDVYRIERVGTTVYYKLNGATFYTSAVPSTTTLMFAFTVNNYAGLLNTRASFAGTHQTVTRNFDYDHAGRLVRTWHSINDATAVLLAKNEYNELGQLADKKLYSTDSEATFKQSLDHRYNIRGWLQNINNSQLTNDGVLNNDTNDLFGFELAYNKPFATGVSTGSSAFYNGNIAAMKWSSNLALGTVKDVAYNYSYDRLNRLASATYLSDAGASWNNPTNQYSESGYAYDLNGNINGFTRLGKTGANMDLLGYAYKGNQLMSVSDGGDIAKGFIDGNVTGDDYVYDANGNMTLDKNKHITAITYNHLNLPTQVTKNTNEKIRYIYDATGRKLSQLVYNAAGAVTKTTDYNGEFIYQNDSLQFISHEEGRAVMTVPATPEYQYHLKDHLGNVRMTFTTKVEQEISTATLETANATTEQGQFLRYDNARRVQSTLFDHTNGAATGYSERLAGGTNEKYGMAKSISVMPGDVVLMEVYAKYVDPAASNTTALTNFLAAIVGGTSPGGTVIDGVGYPTSTSSFNFAGLLGHGSNPDAAPQAYLNYIMFDRDYNPLIADVSQTNFVKISPAAKETGTDIAHERLFAEVTVKQAGYMYIYLSNDNVTPMEVYFDDFKVTQTKSPVVQMEDYYPFGLTFNNYQRENSLINKFQYSSMEMQSDLGLNLLDFGKRTYQTDLSRWTSTDPLAYEYFNSSPYNFVLNNPLKYKDPRGDSVQLIIGAPYTDKAGNEHPYGHVALRVYNSEEGYDNVYDFGRYGAVRGMFGQTGDGILNVYNNSDAYFKEEQSIRTSYGYSKGTTVEEDKKIMSHFNDLIKGGTSNSKRDNKDRKSYKLEDYDITNNNCCTVSGGGLNQIGENWMGNKEYDPRDALKTLEKDYKSLGLSKTVFYIGGVRVTVYDSKKKKEETNDQIGKN